MNLSKVMSKTGCHLGKSGRHLGFSNVHLFGFTESLEISFYANYNTSTAIIN